jgi:hypothetical protein
LIVSHKAASLAQEKCLRWFQSARPHAVGFNHVALEVEDIRVQGVLATTDDEFDDDNDYSVEVSGESYSLSGGPLDKALKIQLVCQNEKGQVVGLDEILLLDDFAG